MSDAASQPAAGEVVLERTVSLPPGVCDGHFPDHPVVPGIAQIIAIAEALGAVEDGPAPVEIPCLRFRRPLGPESTPRLVARGDGQRWRLQLLDHGEVALDGRMTIAELPALELAGEPVTTRSAPVPPMGALPHRRPALLVDGLVARRGADGTVQGVFEVDSPLTRGCRVPAIAALELAAQAAGWLAAMEEAAGDGPPPLGYLVGLRDVRLRAASLPVGAAVVAEIERLAWTPPLGRFGCRATVDGDEIVSGSFTTWAAQE